MSNKQFTKNMNKKTLTKVSERYEAPSLEILSVSMEGVLCQSGVRNSQGLQDFYGSGIEDQSNDWI